METFQGLPDRSPAINTLGFCSPVIFKASDSVK